MTVRRRRPGPAPVASAGPGLDAEVLAVCAAIGKRVTLCRTLEGLAALPPCCEALARTQQQIREVLPRLDGLVLGGDDLTWLAGQVERIGREVLAHCSPAGRA